MHDRKATRRRPHLKRRAGPRAAKALPLARAEALLTVRDVARMLRVSRPTVYSMIRRGELRALYVRHLVRVRPRDLETYVRKREEWVLKHQLQHEAY